MTVLVIQTAFLGDVVLTTPLLDALASSGAMVDVIVTPAGAQVLRGHRSVREVIVYDKKGSSRGVRAFLALAARLRQTRYDVSVIPHRSLRSGLLALFSRVPRRIGFDRSSADWALTDTVRYRPDAHEIDRNLDLLRPLGISAAAQPAPALCIAPEDERHALELLTAGSLAGTPFVAIAPGSVWNTKRWPEERFAALSGLLVRRGLAVVLIGGNEDAELCRRIQEAAGPGPVMNLAGRLSVLQSAAVIRDARALVTNDSAPLHLASAMGTPIVAIFGATSPSFGFGPRGPRDRVVETSGLACRPCAIHGGAQCPTGTFECMLRIDPPRVEAALLESLGR